MTTAFNEPVYSDALEQRFFERFGVTRAESTRLFQAGMAERHRAASRAVSRGRRVVTPGVSAKGGSVGVSYQLEGVRSAIEQLRIVGDKDLPREFGKIVREALSPVVERAKADAPVRSGLLRSRVKAQASQTRASITVKTASDRNEDYAGPVHWGWDGFTRNSERRNIAPNPFVWNAWISEQTTFQTWLERGLADWARRASQRLNRRVVLRQSQFNNIRFRGVASRSTITAEV